MLTKFNMAAFFNCRLNPETKEIRSGGYHYDKEKQDEKQKLQNTVYLFTVSSFIV